MAERELLCFLEVCTTPHGWGAITLLLTWAAVVWAWGRDGATPGW